MLQALHTFAQETPELYTVDFRDDTLTSSGDVPGGLIAFTIVVALVVTIVTIAGMWKVFQKAGKPGWASIVPIYNIIVLLQIIGRPTWWLALYFAGIVPVIGTLVAVVVSIINMHDLSKSFGKSTGYTVLLVLFPWIGYPMLGFGDSKYVGPSAATAQNGGTAATPPVAPTAM